MINVHFNGDVVRCVDTAAIKRMNVIKNFEENRCRHGFQHSKCEVWIKYCQSLKKIQPLSKFGHCTLSHWDNLQHYLRFQQGNIKKQFQIDSVGYRKISSSAHYLVKSSKFKSLFLTLTFPPFRKRHKLTKYIFEHEILNTYFSKFVENLRKNYECGGYVAVFERGKDHNRSHYHILLSIPFIPFDTLNDIWCNCIKNICFFSRNAVTSDPKTLFIKNPARATRYVCKYFSKCKGITSDARVVFMSNNILIKAARMEGCTLESLLKEFKFEACMTSDYTTRYRIYDYKSFDLFCSKFLYPLFNDFVNLPEKNNNFYSFPLDSS